MALLWSVLLPAVDDAIGSSALKPGTTITLNQDVRFTVTSGWVVRGELLGDRPAELTVFRDGVSFTVHSGQFHADAGQLLTTVVSQQRDFTVSGARRDVPQSQGFDGLAEPITGTNFQGAIFAFVQPASTSAPTVGGTAVTPPGTGLTVVVRGRPDLLNQLTDDVARMVASVQFPAEGGGS